MDEETKKIIEDLENEISTLRKNLNILQEEIKCLKKSADVTYDYVYWFTGHIDDAIREYFEGNVDHRRKTKEKFYL